MVLLNLRPLPPSTSRIIAVQSAILLTARGFRGGRRLGAEAFDRGVVLGTLPSRGSVTVGELGTVCQCVAGVEVCAPLCWLRR
ncbi:hypothetical protein GCM10010191_59000 [Actinomadura vinacea]|uniref:Uncharacterized protein n=1 Tax=Actinomadura vinacea TaxID=115336 RepID=A0ABN3JS32_9ACTN